MLKVGARQVAALRGAATTRFVDQVIERLRLDLPRRFGAVAQDQARAKALSAMRKAQDFGVSTEQDVFRFVALTFVFGDDFLRRDWAVPVLKDPSLTRPSERLAVLWEGAPPAGARS